MSSRIPVEIYRSMIRTSLRKDPTILPDIKWGLLTFKDTPVPHESFQYYDKKSQRSHVHGPYENDTSNMLSFVKFCIRELPMNEYTMSRLFYAHKELPTFIQCKKDNDKNEEDFKEELKKKNKMEFTPNSNDPPEYNYSPPFSSSFGTAFF